MRERVVYLGLWAPGGALITCGQCLTFFIPSTISNPPEMRRKVITLCLGLCTITSVCKAQQDSIEIRRHNLQTYKSGDGNCSFSINIKTLQTYFSAPCSLSKLEKSFCSWWSGGNVKVRLEYNELTNEHDKPTYTVSYTNTTKAFKSDVIDVTFSADNTVQQLSFTIIEDQVAVDKMKAYILKLKAAGYTYSLATARLVKAFGNSSTIFCKNASLKVSVSIKTIDENRHVVSIFKS